MDLLFSQLLITPACQGNAQIFTVSRVPDPHVGDGGEGRYCPVSACHNQGWDVVVGVPGIPVFDRLLLLGKEDTGLFSAGGVSGVGARYVSPEFVKFWRKRWC